MRIENINCEKKIKMIDSDGIDPLVGYLQRIQFIASTVELKDNETIRICSLMYKSANLKYFLLPLLLELKVVAKGMEKSLLSNFHFAR